MKVLVNAGGNVTWENTRSVVTTSAAFSLAAKNFGAGDECNATCPGCGRRLPTFCLHLDHILSQSRYTQGIVAMGEELELRSFIHPHGISTNYTGAMNGGIANIFKIGTQSTSLRLSARQNLIPLNVVETATLWCNDLENLQFLCGPCNSRKGNRDFDAIFPGRERYPLAAYI
ncbi:hypothetical protein [Pseudomonas capsici]|uniref:HNH endonuclease n=1 Tax=Pseudomonas capsici TaxID=2810614 RepID=A0ABT3BQP9_9PSED|nr:hypothetical protein [Pseudomonas capsici]MCV4267138.1 hypothetical protein [Pseudomonas capsici]MCV4272731.1 hypothetical protein [Pseudomonas capsici]MCV4276238.1 hypothetical protein [Pseudomonas capsici]MCV4330030.1 hypothetical protein [Pseudomonas capsici]MCV4375118.1 hypothetical protein [Pseudomonas capsici]